MRVTGLDHIVLWVADVERSLTFYIDRLGLTPLRLEPWRRGEVGFPSVRVSDDTIIDLFKGEPTGKNVDHFCLVIEPTDLTAVAESGGFDVVRGPVDVFGARGMGRSIYIRDPDGHLVELRTYPG